MEEVDAGEPRGGGDGGKIMRDELIKKQIEAFQVSEVDEGQRGGERLVRGGRGRYGEEGGEGGDEETVGVATAVGNESLHQQLVHALHGGETAGEGGGSVPQRTARIVD